MIFNNWIVVMKNLSYYFISSGGFLVVIATIVKLSQNANSITIYISGLTMTILGAAMLYSSNKTQKHNSKN